MNQATRRPTAFTLLSTNHGSMLVNRHDYRLVDGGGYGVGYQLLEGSAFDPDEVTLAKELLDSRRRDFGDGVVAVDCGANIGVHTIEWAKCMHGWGDVIAFEAQERIFYALAGNITLNNCFNARAIWAAVGAETGVVRVPVPDYFTPSSFGSLEIRQHAGTEFIGQQVDYSDAATQATQLVALDDMQLARLDFLKIDIEGMELEALAGARATIARCQPLLLVEHIKSNGQQIADFLAPLGYRLFPLGINLLALHTADPLLARLDPA